MNKLISILNSILTLLASIMRLLSFLAGSLWLINAFLSYNHHNLSQSSYCLLLALLYFFVSFAGKNNE